MLGEWSTRGIALFAFVVAILALAVPVIVYVVTRPRLRLSVSNAEVGTERVAEPQRGVEGTATFTSVEIVAHNDGGRTAVIENWGVARYPGTDRQNLWQDVPDDFPRRLGVQPHDSRAWRASSRRRAAASGDESSRSRAMMISSASLGSPARLS